MATSIISQSVLAERIEAQRARIAQLTGLLALAIQGARETQGPVPCDPDVGEDIEQALQIAHDILDDVYNELEATEMVLFKRQDAAGTEGAGT